jgi:hypothetical protein
MYTPDNFRATHDNPSKDNDLSQESRLSTSANGTTDQPLSIAGRVALLREEAVLCNREAKLSSGRARKQWYERKSAALNHLILLGYAEVDSVEFQYGQARVGITSGPIQLHVPPRDLSDDARDVVWQQIAKHLERFFPAQPLAAAPGGW